MQVRFRMTIFLSLFPGTAAMAGSADQVSVVAPYVRLAPPGAKATGAFMTLKNAGDKGVSIVKVESPAAKVTELHNHINDQGVMRMRQVKEIAVPARGETLLKPGSYHVMLIDMKSALKEGELVSITLGFSDGSTKVVEAPVKSPMGDMPAGGMHHGDMKH